jgi:hypothetical protein
MHLGRLLRTLREIGAVAPVGVEVFSDDLRALEPLEIGRRAGAAVKGLLASF